MKLISVPIPPRAAIVPGAAGGFLRKWQKTEACPSLICNLEDAEIVLSPNVALMDQSPNLLGPFFSLFFLAVENPPRAGGSSVRTYNPFSCAD